VRHTGKPAHQPTKLVAGPGRIRITFSDPLDESSVKVPDLAPTWGMSIEMNLRGSNGEEVIRRINNSIFTLE
jgi:hypothetical protein